MIKLLKHGGLSALLIGYLASDVSAQPKPDNTATPPVPVLQNFKALPAADDKFTSQITALVQKNMLDQITPKEKNPDKVEGVASICVVDISDINNPRVGGWNMDHFVYPASTYKMYVLGEVIRQVCEGQLSLSEVYTVDERNVRAGSDLLKDQRVTLSEVLRLMSMYSDNGAANVAIDVVGRKKVSALLHGMNLKGSEVTRKFLPRAQEDAEFKETSGTETSAKHAATYLYAVETGAIGGGRGRGLIKGYLGTNVQNTARFRAGLPASATIYSKTGEWNTFTSEAAIIEDGNTRYIVCVLTVMPLDKAALRMASFVKDVHKLLQENK